MGLQSCQTAKETKKKAKEGSFQASIPEGSRQLSTHVDDGVRLDVVHVGVAEAQLLASSLGGAHDARGDSVLQGERAAYGHHKLARAQVRRAAQQQHRQLHLWKNTCKHQRWNTSHLVTVAKHLQTLMRMTGPSPKTLPRGATINNRQN